MARPIKIGLDYFPLDTGMDEKVELLEAKHGVLGFGVLIKLYQKVYREHGYFYPWGEREQLLFCKWVNVDINSINAIIKDAIEYGLFDAEMFKKGILTSTGIQKRFIEASKRRHELTMFSDLLLVNANIIPVIVGKNPRTVELLQYFVCNNPQIKGNKTKVNKSISSDNQNVSTNSIEPPVKKSKSFTPPTILEVGEYCRANGYNVNPMDFVKYYSESDPPWHDSRGKPVKNWKQKIISTWSKDARGDKRQAVRSGAMLDMREA